MFRVQRTLGLSALVMAIVLVAGCGLRGGRDDGGTRAAPGVVVSDAATPDATTPAPSPTTADPVTSKPAPSKRATSRPKPRASSAGPTEDPNNFQLPACAHHEGRPVTKKQAKAALTAAAGKIYWPTSAPGLKLPPDLVKSIAWHESGWQSDVVNCDGGRGLMQVMPDTTAQMNQRFGQNYDDTDYKQNATVGANYLAWLTKYFAEHYYADKYDLSVKSCRTHTSVCLLNMVIAGYNSGVGAVDEAHASGTLPNPAYVDSVRSLMASCYCDRY